MPIESKSAVERNDAIYPVIGTAQRRNITHRKSQDQARDRVSLGEPSIPVEEYKTAQTPPHSPRSTAPVPSTAPVRVDSIHSFNEDTNPPFPPDLSRLWREKTAIEGAMRLALEDCNEVNYRQLEVWHREISEHLYSLLCSAPETQRHSHAHNDGGPLQELPQASDRVR